MTKEEFAAITGRAKVLLSGPKGAAVALVCLKNGQSIHPDDLGSDDSLTFKLYCEAFAKAQADRAALVKFMEESFELEEFWAQVAQSK